MSCIEQGCRRRCFILDLSYGSRLFNHFTAALLQQVMQLTPEQIAGLPADQQAQVLALQQHMVSRFSSRCIFSVE